jgi:hypothetical protein
MKAGAKKVPLKSTPIKPIFIFSLPRTGSTLLQRVLATHQSISTTSEPWILLPFLYATKENGVFTEYKHRYGTTGIEDFCREMPNGLSDYREVLQQFALSLYSKVSREGSVYFLDKTPPYSLVAQEIMELFPQGKFIFLWRDPTAVISSIISSFGRGKWNLYDYKAELYKGFQNLFDVYEANAGSVCSIRYEDLTTDFEATCGKVFDYLELDFDPNSLHGFSKVKLKGRTGDKTGAKKYDSISTEPLTQRQRCLSNPLRKMWSKRYIRWVGEYRLGMTGYDMKTMIEKIDSAEPGYSNLLSDAARMIFGILNSVFEIKMFIRKVSSIKSFNMLHYHS